MNRFTARLGLCYTRKMSKRTRIFLMQYVRRALLLLAEGIKYWCDEKVADPTE